MKKKMKLITAALVGVMLLVSAAGCGGSNNSGAGATDNSGAAATDNSAASTQGPPVALTMIINNQKGTDDTDPNWPPQAVKDMEQKLNITLNLTSESTDQDKLMIASGNLPDIFLADNQAGTSFMPQLIQGGLIMPLDDLVAKDAPNLASQTTKLDFARQFLSAGTGKLYGITTGSGMSGPSMYPQLAYFVRWDYYTAMGYPAINNADDAIKMLADMVKAHPTTPDGLKTYGLGVFTDWGISWPIGCLLSSVPFNYTSVSGTVNANQDGTFSDPYTDINSALWSSIKLYYEANQLGIFDQDSLTQTSDIYANKCNSGQYMDIIASWWTTTFNQAQTTADPNSLVGYEPLPVPGTVHYSNNNTPIGTSDWQYVIGANSKNPDAAMKMIDYLCSYDGIRAVMCGDPSVTQQTVSGKPEMTDDILQKVAAGDAATKSQFWFNTNLFGYTPTTSDPADGQPLDLFMTPYAFSQQNTPLDKAYCAHYNAQYPFGVFQSFVDQGKMYDYGNYNYTAISAMDASTDDVTAIDQNLGAIFSAAVPQAILAADDAAFQAVFDKCVSDMQAAGIAQSETFWQQNYTKAKAATDSMGK